MFFFFFTLCKCRCRLCKLLLILFASFFFFFFSICIMFSYFLLVLFFFFLFFLFFFLFFHLCSFSHFPSSSLLSSAIIIQLTRKNSTLGLVLVTDLDLPRDCDLGEKQVLQIVSSWESTSEPNTNWSAVSLTLTIMPCYLDLSRAA